ncbi:hypothetical protein CIG2463D_0585 [Campylobacter iguaniorum]|nr:hypothetical protein CIG2463D_0585 [Campylobacter iguaniorum]
MLANQTIRTITRLLPIIGRKPALIHHLKQAGLKATNYNGFMHQLKLTANNQTVEKGIRAELNAFLKSIENEPNNPNGSGNPIKGDNFVMIGQEKPYFTQKVYFELDEKLRDITQLDEKINVSLAWMKAQHPEMFKTQRAVKEMIDYVINQPTIIKDAKKPNSVLIGKLNNKKANDIAVNRENSEIYHANIRKATSKEKADGRDALPLHLDADNVSLAGRDSVGVKTLSSANNDIIPQSTTKEQILASAKDKIAKGKEPTLDEKKALVDERRAEIKSKSTSAKNAQLQTDNLSNSSNINEKSVYNLPNLAKNEPNTQNISTNLADDEIQAITDLSSQIDELKALRKNGKYPDAQTKKLMHDKSNELGKMLEARISSGKSVNQKLVKDYKHQIERARNERLNQSNVVNEPNLGKTFDDNSIQDIVKNLASNKELAVELKPNNSILQTVNDFKKPIKTPLFESKINLDILFNHLSDKNSENRLKYINLVKPTLENPLFIAKNGDRYEFVKTFLDDDKVLKYLTIIENDKGEFLGISAMPIKNTDLKNKLKGNIILGGDTLSTLSTPQVAKQGVEAMSSIIPQFAKDYNLDMFKWDNGLKPKKAATTETVGEIRDIQAKFEDLSPKQKAEIRKYLIDKP